MIQNSPPTSGQDLQVLALVLSRLVHEVRSPLQAVKGFGILLEERVDDSQRDLAHKLVLAAAQLEAVVEEIASPANWLAPRPGIERQRNVATVGEVIDRVLAIVQIEADRHNVIVEVDSGALGFGSPGPRVIAAAQLVQVLVNLVVNAIRFSAPGGMVAVTVRHTRGWRIVVADQGPGVDPADAERIFQPFEKGGDRTGAGLGLFISRTIVEAARGRLVLEAEPHDDPGPTEGPAPRGARFVVELPET